MEKQPIRVLLIDDDTLLGNILTTTLTSEGLEVHYQSSLTGLKAIVKEFEPNIAVLDIEVGIGDGISRMTDIRQVTDTLPVIIISSHTEADEVKRALQQGAIVYLKKPIDVYELKAYIERYAHEWKQTILHIGEMKLNTETRTLIYQGEEVKRLTWMEYSILNLLHEQKGISIPYSDFRDLWEDGVMSEASLQNLISRVRKILSIDPTVSIESIGKGYKLNI